MSYSLSPERTQANRELLDHIALAVNEDRPLKLEPQPGITLSKLAYQVHEALASAEAYPDRSFDKTLRKVTRVRTDRLNGLIIIESKADTQLDSVAATILGTHLTSVEATTQLARSDEPEQTLEWYVQQDKQAEAQAFINACEYLGWQVRLLSENDKHHKHFLTWLCKRSSPPQDTPKRPERSPFDLLSQTKKP